MRNLLRCSLLAAALLACGDSGSDRASAPTGGTLVISVPADADYLIPPIVATAQGKQAVDQLFDHLAAIGAELNTIGDAGFTPRLAERWAWAPDSLSIAFHLDPDARWHDGVPVRANDVRFTHDLYSDPAIGSQITGLIRNIDSVTVRDSLTAVFWFGHRSPEQFFAAAYQLMILPEHALRDVDRPNIRAAEFNRNPIGSGRFRFARWVPGQTLELTADTANYRGRARLDRVIWSVAPDFNTAVTKLYTGDADFFEYLRPDDITEVAKHDHLEIVPYPVLQYGFMLFNLRDGSDANRAHPLFGDRELRRALAMAVDREGMVRNVLDSLGVVAVGPAARSLASVDTTLPQIPHDPERARATLDSLGWRDADADGIRERNGRPLEFTLTTPTSSATRMKLSVLMQEQLKQVGAKVNLEPLEFGTFMERQNQRRFDAVMGLWMLDPTPAGIRQSWSSAGARGEEGSNYGSYANPVFDALVDSAMAQFDPARSREYYTRAYATVVADAPAIFLYEPKAAAGAHQRVQTAGMRADAWWANLADWTIAPDQRIARDEIGLQGIVPTTAAADTARR